MFSIFFLVLTWFQSVKGGGFKLSKRDKFFQMDLSKAHDPKKITLESRITTHLSNAESNKLLTRSTNFVTIVRDYYDDLQQYLL